MKKALAYYRVSTEEQAKSGISIEAQKKIILKWAKDNDYTITGHYTDEGKSASNINRPALQDMLSQVEEDSVDAVLVIDTDRIARNTLDHLTIKSILKKHNTALISVNQPMLDDSPEGNLIDTIIASVNAFQSQITGRKTSKVMEQKALSGWYPGSAPIGYLNADNPEPIGKFDKRIIIKDPETSTFITEAFNMYINGSTAREIAKYLNENNVRASRSEKIHFNTVLNILKNTFYMGTFYWGGKEYKGLHEPLVTEENFNLVNNLMSEKNLGVKKRTHDFLLRGYLYSTTGSKLYGSKHTKPSGKIYSFYFCEESEVKQYIDSDKLEKDIEKRFKGIEISSEYVDLILRTAQQIIEDSRSNQSEHKRQIQLEISKYQKAMYGLEDERFVLKTIDQNTFADIHSRYVSKIEDLNKQLMSNDADYSVKIKQLEYVLRLAEDIGNAYKTASDSIKRDYLSIFIDKVVIDMENKKIAEIVLKDNIKQFIEEGSVRITHYWGG